MLRMLENTLHLIQYIYIYIYINLRESFHSTHNQPYHIISQIQCFCDNDRRFGGRGGFGGLRRGSEGFKGRFGGVQGRFGGVRMGWERFGGFREVRGSTPRFRGVREGVEARNLRSQKFTQSSRKVHHGEFSKNSQIQRFLHFESSPA
jgi:hypothetical protein